MTPRACPALDTLIDALAWRVGSRPYAGTHAALLITLEHAWRTQIAAAIALGVTGASRVAEMIDALPAQARERLLVAPEAVRRLLHAKLGALTLAWFGEAAEAEAAQLGTPATGPRWTALGDQYFPAGKTCADLAPDPTSGESEAEFDRLTCYAAPTIGPLIVDHASPHALGVHGPTGFAEEATSGACARIALRKLRCAAQFLGAVGDEVAAFVETGIVTLVLRSTRTHDVIGSSSTPDCLGRAVAWNAHAPAATIGELTEQLLHEAIHGHAYRLELTVPFLDTGGRLADRRIVSPWSGRPLPLHGYLHACFVWYGLACFWLAVLERRRAPAEAVAPHLTRATAGFAADLTDLLGDAQSAVAPPVLDGIARIQRDMQSRMAGTG